MKDQPPAKRDAGSAGSQGPTPHNAARESPRPATPPVDEERPLVVRFHARMHPQRVYPLTVEAGRTGRRGGTGNTLPATIRPVIPRALVVPAEQNVDASIPGARAAFHVTPLARRRLHGACIEVHQASRPAQRIPLRMKVVTQLSTFLLLALTFLVPWGLVELARNPLRGTVYERQAGVVHTRGGQPDEVLRDRMRAAVHADLPAIPGVTQWIASDAHGENFPEDRRADDSEHSVIYDDLASWLSWVYKWTLAWCDHGLVVYSGLMLLVLTLASWMLHRSARGQHSQILFFAAPRLDAGAETLPLAGEEEARTI